MPLSSATTPSMRIIGVRPFMIASRKPPMTTARTSGQRSPKLLVQPGDEVMPDHASVRRQQIVGDGVRLADVDVELVRARAAARP